MENTLRKYIYLIVVLAVGVLITSVKVVDKNLGKNGDFGVINWDNFGYYLYLPAFLIQDDIKIKNEKWVIEAQKKYNLSPNFYQAHKLPNGNHVIQYTSGMALLYAPAFSIGHLYAKISSKYEADGFSAPYQVCVLIQSILILFVGLFFLFKLGRLFFKDKIVLALFLVICLGTNYFQLAAANISTPHLYLFGVYSVLLYLIIKWHLLPKVKTAFLIGLLGSIMVLVRPNELLFLIIPLFITYGKFKSLRQKLKFLISNKKQILALILPFIFVGIIQPLYWKYVTDDWIYDSYKNEDFKLLKPYLLEYLFSYKKGWLLYTPIMIVGIAGFFLFIKKNKGLGIPMAIFLALYIWVLSSWDCWWYADSFSQRSIVQAYPIFLFPFGYLISSLERKSFITKAITIGIALLLVFYNLFLTWQFKEGILHSQRMTKEFYWNVFGKTDIKKVNYSLLDVDRNLTYIPEDLDLRQRIIYSNNYTENREEQAIEGTTVPQEGGIPLSLEQQTSYKFRFPIKKVCDTSYCFIVARIRYKSNFEAKENPFGIEFNMIDSYNGKSYKYKYKGVEEIKTYKKGEWATMDFVIVPPVLRYLNDSIQVNLYLKGEKPVTVDQFVIESYDPSRRSKADKEVFMNDYTLIKKGDWSNATNLIDKKVYEKINNQHQYSTTFKKKIGELFKKQKIKFSTIVASEFTDSLECYAVISISNSDKNVFYKSFIVNHNKKEWVQKSFEVDLPENLSENAELKCYLWNKSSEALLIREIKLELM